MDQEMTFFGDRCLRVSKEIEDRWMDWTEDDKETCSLRLKEGTRWATATLIVHNTHPHIFALLNVDRGKATLTIIPSNN